MPIDLTSVLPQIEEMAEHAESESQSCPLCGGVVKIKGNHLKCLACGADGFLVTDDPPAQTDSDHGGGA